MQRFDYLILGGGVAGLATAWHLGRAGAARVLVLEREPTLGSMASGQNAAILRTFSADRITSTLARASAQFLREPPPGFSPVPLVDPVGLLLFASGETANALRNAWGEAGAAASAVELEPADAHRAAPHAGPSLFRDHELCLHFPGDGRIDVAALLDAFAAGARRAGVEIRTDAAALRLSLERGRVSGVELADGTRLSARTTVVAAGGWADRLGRTAGSNVRLRPTRRHLMVTAPDERVDRSLPVVWAEDAGFYCRPESGGLLLSACDLTDVDPDTCVADASVKESIARKTARFLPAFEQAGAAFFWHGIRTLTADDRFAIGPDPDVDGLFWVAGLGGHGMTCGAEVGRIAAALLTGDEPRTSRSLLRALDPARLACAAPPHPTRRRGQSVSR